MGTKGSISPITQQPLHESVFVAVAVIASNLQEEGFWFPTHAIEHFEKGLPKT